MKKSEMIYTHRVEQCNQTVSKSGDKKEKLKLRQYKEVFHFKQD